MFLSCVCLVFLLPWRAIFVSFFTSISCWLSLSFSLRFRLERFVQLPRVQWLLVLYLSICCCAYCFRPSLTLEHFAGGYVAVKDGSGNCIFPKWVLRQADVFYAFCSPYVPCYRVQAARVVITECSKRSDSVSCVASARNWRGSKLWRYVKIKAERVYWGGCVGGPSGPGQSGALAHFSNLPLSLFLCSSLILAPWEVRRYSCVSLERVPQ